MAWVLGIGSSRGADSSVFTGTLVFRLFVISSVVLPRTVVGSDQEPLSGRWRQHFPAKHCKSLSDYMSLHSRRHSCYLLPLPYFGNKFGDVRTVLCLV